MYILVKRCCTGTIFFSRNENPSSFQADSRTEFFFLFFFVCTLQRLSCCVSFLLTFFVPPVDSTLLISDFEPQPASGEVGTEDEFDPIPVTGRKNSQGESLNCLC